MRVVLNIIITEKLYRNIFLRNLSAFLKLGV